MPRGVISIAAYEAAFESYDYSLASTIAMIMGAVQLVVVVVVLGAPLACLSRADRGRERMTDVARPAAPRPAPGIAHARGRTSVAPRWSERLWAAAVWALVALFVVNLLALIGSVIASSFATRWLGTWFPAGVTVRWYLSAWDEFQLSDVLYITFQVVGTVVAVSGLIGVPAAYALARRDFPGKRAVILLLLLPLLVPSVTYGIPLATVLYKMHLGGTLFGVILANLVPDGALRGAGDDPLHRADRPQDRMGRPGVRRGNFSGFRLCAGADPDAGSAGVPVAGHGADHRHVRADLPGVRAGQPDPGGRPLITRCSRPACGRSSRSTPWP